MFLVLTLSILKAYISSVRISSLHHCCVRHTVRNFCTYSLKSPSNLVDKNPFKDILFILHGFARNRLRESCQRNMLEMSGLFFLEYLGFNTPSHLQRRRRVFLPLKQSLLLFWGYFLPGKATCIISRKAQNDVLLRTADYSPMSRYTIFEATFMLLAHTLIYHFILLCLGRPFSCGVHIQSIFSLRSISTHYRALHS